MNEPRLVLVYIDGDVRAEAACIVDRDTLNDDDSDMQEKVAQLKPALRIFANMEYARLGKK